MRALNASKGSLFDLGFAGNAVPESKATSHSSFGSTTGSFALRTIDSLSAAPLVSTVDHVPTPPIPMALDAAAASSRYSVTECFADAIPISFKWYAGGTILDFEHRVRGDEPSHCGNIGSLSDSVRSRSLRGDTEHEESSEFVDCDLCSSDNSERSEEALSDRSESATFRVAVGLRFHLRPWIVVAVGNRVGLRVFLRCHERGDDRGDAQRAPFAASCRVCDRRPTNCGFRSKRRWALRGGDDDGDGELDDHDAINFAEAELFRFDSDRFRFSNCSCLATDSRSVATLSRQQESGSLRRFGGEERTESGPSFVSSLDVLSGDSRLFLPIAASSSFRVQSDRFGFAARRALRGLSAGGSVFSAGSAFESERIPSRKGSRAVAGSLFGGDCDGER